MIKEFSTLFNMVTSRAQHCSLAVTGPVTMVTVKTIVTDNDNDNDNENMFITIDLHIYKIQDARYQYTENKHQTLFFLW